MKTARRVYRPPHRRGPSGLFLRKVAAAAGMPENELVREYVPRLWTPREYLMRHGLLFLTTAGVERLLVLLHHDGRINEAIGIRGAVFEAALTPG
jgi:hypothetical protein